MDYTDYDSITAGLFDGLAIFSVIFLLIVLVAVIFGAIGLWKIYKKAGRKGWESIIPIYGYWVLVEIAGLNWWWFLLIIADSITSLIGLDDLSAVLSLVSIFASFNCYYNIAKKFNKGVGFAIGLTLLTPIFASILGFSKDAVYDNRVAVSKNGCFGSPDSDVNYMNNDSSITFCGNCGAKLSKGTKFCHNCGKEV